MVSMRACRSGAALSNASFLSVISSGVRVRRAHAIATCHDTSQPVGQQSLQKFIASPFQPHLKHAYVAMRERSTHAALCLLKYVRFPQRQAQY